MEQYIKKSDIVSEIERIKKEECPIDTYEGRIKLFYFERFLSFLDTLEMKEVGLDLGDPNGDKSSEYIVDTKTLEVEEADLNDSIKAGIQAHAETYSFNIESQLFHQLTEEQQKLWRKEIEQACISGGNAGVELARDIRYKENLETKEVDLEKEFDNYAKDILACDIQFEPFTHLYNCAKYFYELGLKAREGE